MVKQISDVLKLGTNSIATKPWPMQDVFSTEPLKLGEPHSQIAAGLPFTSPHTRTDDKITLEVGDYATYVAASIILNPYTTGRYWALMRVTATGPFRDTGSIGFAIGNAVADTSAPAIQVRNDGGVYGGSLFSPVMLSETGGLGEWILVEIDYDEDKLYVATSEIPLTLAREGGVIGGYIHLAIVGVQSASQTPISLEVEFSADSNNLGDFVPTEGALPLANFVTVLPEYAETGNLLEVTQDGEYQGEHYLVGDLAYVSDKAEGKVKGFRKRAEVISSNIIARVPQDFATLPLAMAYLSQFAYTSDAKGIIRIDVEHTLTDKDRLDISYRRYPWLYIETTDPTVPVMVDPTGVLTSNSGFINISSSTVGGIVGYFKQVELEESPNIRGLDITNSIIAHELGALTDPLFTEGFKLPIRLNLSPSSTMLLCRVKDRATDKTSSSSCWLSNVNAIASALVSVTCRSLYITGGVCDWISLEGDFTGIDTVHVNIRNGANATVIAPPNTPLSVHSNTVENNASPDSTLLIRGAPEEEGGGFGHYPIKLRKNNNLGNSYGKSVLTLSSDTIVEDTTPDNQPVFIVAGDAVVFAAFDFTPPETVDALFKLNKGSKLTWASANAPTLGPDTVFAVTLDNTPLTAATFGPTGELLLHPHLSYD